MSEIQKASILIVDKDKEFRDSVKILLKLYGCAGRFYLHFLEETDCFKTALNCLKKSRIDLILLGFDNHIEDDWKLEILQSYRKSKIIILSNFLRGDIIFYAMNFGACGYIHKKNIANQLKDAIATILNSQIYFPPDVASCFFNYSSDLYAADSRRKRNWQGKTVVNKPFNLTLREKEVLRHLIEGCTNQNIAGNLCISVATVKAHLSSIFQKLQVETRSQAIIKSLNYNLDRLLVE